MDNPEKLVTLGTQDIRRRHIKQNTWLNIRGIETLSHQYTWLNIRGIETLSHQYTWLNIRGIETLSRCDNVSIPRIFSHVYWCDNVSTLICGILVVSSANVIVDILSKAITPSPHLNG
jgi:hypothetical protein